ncbi:MAG: helix-turn-helix transcriptional regulator [Acidimicrobiales bacterium]|nr:helix-turn-helix transcriptional regulator [Acidimicrobiales bacterium]
MTSRVGSRSLAPVRTSGDEWPFVARADLLQHLERSFADGHTRGAVIVGPAGSGKTRLAREYTQSPRRWGRPRWLFGTASGSHLPLSALLPLVDDLSAAADAPTRTRPRLQHVLETAALRGDLMLVVDDCHLVDEESASVLHDVFREGDLRVLLTARAGETAPSHVERLVGDEAVVEVTLGLLDAGGVRALLAAVLEGPVSNALVHTLHEASSGNVLFLRELLLASLGSGSVALVDGLWVQQGPLSTSTLLSELVSERIAVLDPDHLEIAELVAQAEVLSLEHLLLVTSDAMIRSLEDRDVIMIEDTAGQPRCRISHPLLGELLRDGTPAVRRRSGFLRLADTAELLTDASDATLLAAIGWRFAGDEVPDDDVLAKGCAMAMARGAFDLAARCGAARWQRSPDVAGAVRYARALMSSRRHQDCVEAERVLASVEATALDAEPGARIVALALRSINLASGLGDADASLALLETAEARTGEDQAILGLALATQQLYAGQPSKAAATLARWASNPSPFPSPFPARLRAKCLLIAGRCQEALDLDATLEEPAGLEGTFVAVRVRQRWGEFDPTRELATDALRRGSATQDVGNILPVMLGADALIRGEAHAAIVWFKQACVEGMVEGYHALGGLIEAAALCGELGEASRALDRLGPHAEDPPGPFGGAVIRGIAHLKLATGAGVGEAARLLHEAAVEVGEHGQGLFEADMLIDLVRFRRASAEECARLTQVAEQIGGPWMALCASYGRAWSCRDHRALRTASAELEAIGDVRTALAAAWSAAVVAFEAGATHEVTAALEHAERLGARTDFGNRFRPPPALLIGLTDREREIAELAGQGRPSKRIAAELSLSPRTVDNCLQRTYDKLGLSGRAELMAALHPELA